MRTLWQFQVPKGKAQDEERPAARPKPRKPMLDGDHLPHLSTGTGVSALYARSLDEPPPLWIISLLRKVL
jgi:hypothetical protein